MLGLLALVGVTFATFSGQARINNRNYQQSLLMPQADELMDFALAQLISDTDDVRSAIRGHSLARDMYGTGSTSNGYLPLDPTTGLPFYITAIAGDQRHGQRLHPDHQYRPERPQLLRLQHLQPVDHAGVL